MGIQRRRLGRSTIALAGTVAVLAGAGSAVALQGLPPGVQVNDDPGAGINPALNVSGEDPANADVVGGALTAGKPAVPWAVFRQTEAGGAHDQIFSRSFAGGAWTTRGSGHRRRPLERRAAVQRLAELRPGPGRRGPGDRLRRRRTHRAVGDVVREHRRARASTTTTSSPAAFDATQNKWVFAGQGRGTGGIGSVQVPSLNIHTDQDAENPSVAGGNAGTPTTAPDPTKPGPWITWQETSTRSKGRSIRTRSSSSGRSGRARRTAPASPRAGPPPRPRGGFCWQQTGIRRFGAGTLDPSLNVDPTRNGVEPDIAFTGAQDSVPWVVWYEKDATGTSASNQLRTNEMVFAAKGVTDGEAADGGFHWVAVGNSAQGMLDTSGTAPQNFGTCAAIAAIEEQLLAERRPDGRRRGPARGRRHDEPGQPDRAVGGLGRDRRRQHQVFVSRLVGAGAAARFVLANGGQPISPAQRRRDPPGHHVLGQHAVRDVADRRTAATRTTEPSGTSSTRRTRRSWWTRAASRSPRPARAGQADVREPISSGLHRQPVQRGRRNVPGWRVGNAVLPVHQRDEPAQPVRRRLPAGCPGDRRGQRRGPEHGDRVGQRQPRGGAGERLVPVRDHHRLRAVHGGAAHRPRQRG